MRILWRRVSCYFRAASFCQRVEWGSMHQSSRKVYGGTNAHLTTMLMIVE
jgi:hypothetical protein